MEVEALVVAVGTGAVDDDVGKVGVGVGAGGEGVAVIGDGVVLVVKAESTSYEMVSRAVDLLGRDRLMGVVLNRATEMPHRASYDYSKYYYSGGQQLPAPRG